MFVKELMFGEFACVFVDETNLQFSKKYKLLNINVERLTVSEILKLIDFRNVSLVLEFDCGKTLVFSSAYLSDVFEFMQKKYKDKPSYYFMANNTMACFKILENGKITRKVSSYGHIRDGRISCEEQTIGKPCLFETENSKDYKMKYDYRSIDLSKKDIFEMVDFYVGFDSLEDSKIISKKLYVSDDAVNVKFVVDSFNSPEFNQSLIHIGGDFDCEFTIPFAVFETNQSMEYAFLKERVEVKNLKSAKKMFGLNIFNQSKTSRIKTDAVSRTDVCDFSLMLSIKNAIREVFSVHEDYKTMATKITEAFHADAEIIPAKLNVFYFVCGFENGKFKADVFAVMKKGKEIGSEKIATIDDSFKKENLQKVYNQILDFCLNQNLSEQI